MKDYAAAHETLSKLGTQLPVSLCGESAAASSTFGSLNDYTTQEVSLHKVVSAIWTVNVMILMDSGASAFKTAVTVLWLLHYHNISATKVGIGKQATVYHVCISQFRHVAQLPLYKDRMCRFCLALLW